MKNKRTILLGCAIIGLSSVGFCAERAQHVPPTKQKEAVATQVQPVVTCIAIKYVAPEVYALPAKDAHAPVKPGTLPVKMLFGILGIGCIRLKRDANAADSGGGAAPPALDPAPNLQASVVSNYNGLTDGDQKQNVIDASAANIAELKALTFGGMSALGEQIMANQVAMAINAVEEATKTVLDALG